MTLRRGASSNESMHIVYGWAEEWVGGLVAEGWVYGWLSRFKLIHLEYKILYRVEDSKRISLATLPKSGRRDEWVKGWFH